MLPPTPDAGTRIGNPRSLPEQHALRVTAGFDTEVEINGYARLDNVFDPAVFEDLLDGRPRPAGRTAAVHRFSTQPLLTNLAREFLGDGAQLLNTVLWEYSERLATHSRYFNEHTVFDAPPGAIIRCAIALTDIPHPVTFRILSGGHRPERGFLQPNSQPVDRIHPLLETVEPLTAGSMLIFNSSVPRRFGTGGDSLREPAVLCSVQFAARGPLPPLLPGFHDADGTFRLPDESCVEVVHNGSLRCPL